MLKNSTCFKRTWGLNPLLLIALVSFTAFALSRCSFKEPSAPSWDVEVAIPLISKVYTMKELAEEESSINLDSTGVLSFEFEAELENYYVDDELVLENVQEEFRLALGNIDIDSPGSQSSSVDLREIFANADALDGQDVVVPAFDFESEKKPHNYEGYAYVIIETGQIEFEVQNDLAIPLGSPLTIELWDQTQDTLITSATAVTQIAAGSSAIFAIDLAGATLPSQLAVRMTGSSPGSQGGTVVVDARSRFSIAANIGDMEVIEALAEIPAQVVTNEDQITIDDSFVIVDAHIEQGVIDLSVNGNLPLDTWITYELPDFISPSQTSLIDSFFVAQNSSPSIYIDLAGYSLQPAIADFGEQKVQFTWTARTIDTGTNMVLVRSEDEFSAQMNLSNLQFSQVTGKMAGTDIEVTLQEIEFDIPADLDSIFFETARMELVLDNRINFQATLNLMIEGRNESGGVSFLTVNAPLQAAGQPGTPTMSTIILDQENSNIKEFISILPSLLRVGGKVTLGGDNKVGTVSKGDYVNGMVKISAPLAIRLPEQEIDLDANEIEIDEDVQNDIIENIASGSFYAEITNHLPLGAAIEFFFSQDSVDVYNNPILRIGPIDANAAPVDAGGLVQNAQASEVTLSLNEQEMRTFLRSPLYAGIRIRTDGSSNQFVRIMGSDYIQIKAYSKIKIKVNQD